MGQRCARREERVGGYFNQKEKDGPKTLNGLITEYLETIPDANICFTIEGYRFEIVQIQDNMIRTAKLSEPPEPF